jgi:ribosomal protein S18 acetylase RimI-like enzyme
MGWFIRQLHEADVHRNIDLRFGEAMIFVRKATQADSDIIAKYLFLAMGDIVCKFIGQEDNEKAREFMMHFVKADDNQYSYQNCWVAEENAKVVAAVNLYNGALLGELRRPVAEYLKSRFSQDFNYGDETQAGEYYIDSIGVSPDRQGKGVGSALLRAVIDEYVNKHGQTLGLLVDEANPAAKRLYLKLGFKSAGRRVLFGKSMEHLQIKG